MNFIAARGVGLLIDTGLANFLGLETLRHGTNLINYLGIRIFGGDPNQCNSVSGSGTGEGRDLSKTNYFYLFNEEEQKAIRCDAPLPDLVKRWVVSGAVLKRLFSRNHAAISYFNLVRCKIFKKKCEFPPQNLSKCEIVGLGISAVLGFSLPILKFRFSQIDHERLQDDPEYGGLAYRTTEKVDMWRIGFLGTLITGVNLNWLARAKQNPCKVLTGVAQLSAAVALTVLCAPDPRLIIIGLMFA